MAITQEFFSLDAYYRRSSGDKIIVNDLNQFNISDIEKLNSSLMTVYNNTDTLSTVPSCDCNELKGRYLIGRTCQACGTVCKEVHEKVEPLLWLKSISPNLKFMNPDFWLVFRTIIDKKIDYLRWMCDSKYNPPVELPNFMYGIKELLKEERTYENTMSKIPAIIKYLLNHAKFKDPDKQENLKLVLSMWNKEKESLFSDYLPIINKKLFVMENTTKGRFTNLATSDVIDIVMSWMKIVNDEKPTIKKQSNSTAAIISKLATLYYVYFDSYIVKKIGVFRKHVYGARSHFTFRAVITSIPGRHLYNEVHVPWAIGVTAFRPHILNKLMKRGYRYKEANVMLFRAVKKYTVVIDEILNELISESPYMGIPILIQRNPSLKQGSSTRRFITQFKTDIDEATISISGMDVKPMNADFDGDEVNATMLLDNLLAEEFKTLDTYYNIPDTTKPYSVSGNLNLLSPANSILSSYLYDTKEEGVDTIVSKLNMVEVNLE